MGIISGSTRMHYVRRHADHERAKGSEAASVRPDERRPVRSGAARRRALRIRWAMHAPDGGALETAWLDASSVVAFVEIAPDGLVRRANPRFVELLEAAGEHELLGRPMTELVAERKIWATWHASALAGGERGVRLAFRGRKGGNPVLEGDLFRPSHASDDSLFGLFVDVTEETRLREALQRGARMEALGSLTSGIAHDFNNLLTVLVGNLYLVAEDLRGDEQTFRKLKAARDAANRGADLIKELLAFARRDKPKAEEVDPGGIVGGLVPLLKRALGRKITLDIRTGSSSSRVRCNPAQLESAIVNLAMNARDAIVGSGRIAIVTEDIELGGDDAARHGLPPGPYVRLDVADNGSGIPPAALPRVFEPFFTTKGDQGGTGLGLSMVRWFAEQSGGTVSIDSTLGCGTAVSLLLPRSTDAAAETMSKTAPLSTLPGGDECIGVFSRDDGVRSTIEQILRVLGYDVHTAGEAGDMLERLRSRQIEVLVVDGAGQDPVSRRRLIAAARRVRPGVKIVATADAADAVPADARPRFLAKPFSIADVARAVRGAVDADEAEG